jgi:hypothetical protein
VGWYSVWGTNRYSIQRCSQDITKVTSGTAFPVPGIAGYGSRHDKEDNRTIIQILSFVAISRRPLTVAELSEACQSYQDEDEETRLRFTQEDIEMCRLMIIVQDGIVRLLHKSVRDFLVDSRGGSLINDLEAHAALANRCISHFLYSRHSVKKRKWEI